MTLITVSSLNATGEHFLSHDNCAVNIVLIEIKTLNLSSANEVAGFQSCDNFLCDFKHTAYVICSVWDVEAISEYTKPFSSLHERAYG